MAMDNERGVARVNTVNALFNVTLNLLLIPSYGLLGAAVTTVLTEIVGVMQYYFLLRHKVDAVDLKTTLVRPLASGLIMSVFVWMVRTSNLLLAIGVGAAVYTGCILVTGAISSAETRFLGRLLLRRAAVEVE